MTDADLFDAETQYAGGRFAYELVDEPIRATYVEIADRAANLIASVRRELPKLPPIHFDFIFDGRINALAFQAENRYFIGLTTGALYMLRLVIGRMLADPRAFTFVGQSHLEASDLPPLFQYVPHAQQMVDQGTRPVTPHDTVRASYFWYLLDQAIMFLLGHEVAHITRGHVDYLTATHGIGFTAPVEWIKTQGQEATLERQCLEIDADRRSIVSRIDSMRLMSLDPSRTMPPWSPHVYEPGDIIRDWAASIGIVFRLFGDVRFDPAHLHQLTYPPLPIRRILCEMMAVTATEKLWDDKLAPLVRQASSQARILVELGFAAILGTKASGHGLFADVPGQGRDHLDRLQDFWSAHVLAALEPFSYE